MKKCFDLFRQFRIVFSAFLMISSIMNQTASAQNIANLEVVLKTTFEKNPNVRISSLSIDFQQGRILQAQGQFNPSLNFGINKSFNLSPTTKAQREGLLGFSQNESFKSDLLDYELSLTKRFQTGTLIKSSLEFTNFGRNALYDDLSKAGLGQFMTNRGRLFFDVTQPLLQGRGKKFYSATLDVEKLRLNQAQLNYAFDVSSQTYLVILNYLSVVSARRELEIQISIETNYTEFEEQLRMLSEKDVIPKAELTFINANLARQHVTVLNSRSSYLSAKNRLLESMGLPSSDISQYDFESMQYGLDSLQEEIEDGYLAYWLEKASTTRRDYLAAQKNVSIKKREIEYAENKNQARLDFTAGVGYNGIYESNSFEQYVSSFYSNIPGLSYRAGLVFQWPMGMMSTKGAYASALAEKQTSEQTVKSIELNIQQQLSSQYNNIIYYNEAVKQGQLSVDFNLKARTNEYLKLQLGISAVVNLVQVQNNYAIAQTSLNRLQFALNSSVIRFRFESGNLIEISELNEVVVDVDELFSLPKIKVSE